MHSLGMPFWWRLQAGPHAYAHPARTHQVGTHNCNKMRSLTSDLKIFLCYKTQYDWELSWSAYHCWAISCIASEELSMSCRMGSISCFEVRIILSCVWNVCTYFLWLFVVLQENDESMIKLFLQELLSSLFFLLLLPGFFYQNIYTY